MPKHQTKRLDHWKKHEILDLLKEHMATPPLTSPARYKDGYDDSRIATIANVEVGQVAHLRGVAFGNIKGASQADDIEQRVAVLEKSNAELAKAVAELSARMPQPRLPLQHNGERVLRPLTNGSNTY